MKEVLYPDLIGEIAKRGETSAYLGKKIGLTYSAMWRRLTGKKDWSNSEIDNICQHYGKTYEELFKKKGN